MGMDMAASVGDASDAVRDGANPPPERGGSLLLNRAERVAAPNAPTKSPHRDDVCLGRESPLRPDALAGIGRRLHEWLIEPARVAGIASIRLELRADNAAALSFYRRLGSPNRSLCLATAKAMSLRAG